MSKPKVERVDIRLTSYEKNLLKLLCDSEDKTFTEFIKEVIKEKAELLKKDIGEEEFFEELHHVAYGTYNQGCLPYHNNVDN
jgi:uncharacterized protein (DUF1778 family)